MLILLLITGYLLGSIPFGFLIAKIWKVDIRSKGSGNIGATNVFRTLGPIAGGTVFVLDFLKGTLAVGLGYWASGDPLTVLLLGAAAVFGHMYSPWLGFKGGKGAATGLGALAGLAPEIFIIALLIAALIIYTTRYVSVASMATAVIAAFLMLLFGKPWPYTLVTFLVAIFMIIRHIPNLKRLRKGTEAKI